MKDIIVYGVGAAFRNYFNSSDNTPNILFAIDNNLDRESIYGINVYKNDYLKEYIKETNTKDYFIVIFAMSSAAVNMISEELTRMGLKYKEDFDEYSVLIKDHIKIRLINHGVPTRESEYLFTKSALKNLNIDNQSSVIGSWIMMSILKETKDIQGDIIELGAYKCGLSYLLTLYKTLFNDFRKYYIVDSFEGFKDYVSKFDPMFLKDMFKDASFEKTVDMFKDFDDVIIEKGFIPEVLTKFESKQFSLVYYDCDTYQSCKESLEYFFPKLSSGGYFIIHDYFAKEEGAVGVKKAVDEFLDNNSDIDIIILPETTHIILRK